jgi:hypothetical protein
MLVSGAVLTVSGTALGIAGVFAVIKGSAAPMGPPGPADMSALAMFVPGVLAFAGGITLLTVGSVRHTRWEAWRASAAARWSPSPGRTPHGTWTLGLTLRF